MMGMDVSPTLLGSPAWGIDVSAPQQIPRARSRLLPILLLVALTTMIVVGDVWGTCG